MSVAVGHAQPNGENLARTVIRRLVGRDEAAGIDLAIEPGASVDSFQIHRTSEGYVMEFASMGRRLRAELALFQARTEPAVPAPAEESRASEAEVTA